MNERTARIAGLASAGSLAGVGSGLLLSAYFAVVDAALAHRGVGFRYQYVASGALGPHALADPRAALPGFLLHLAIAVMWGIGYAFAADSTPQLRARPALSGAVFGIVVYLAMQLVEIGAGIYVLPDPSALLNLLVAHTLFYGIPLAYIVAARTKANVTA